MTPKEKAIDLVEDMSYSCRECDYESRAKYAALICVDEIIKALPPFEYGLEFVAKIEYWNEVKQEIQKL